MTETFRLRKAVKYLGMGYSAFFLVILIGHSSIFFLEKPDEHGFAGEHSVAVVGGMCMAVYGTMLLLSVYTWAAYYVKHFTIDGTTISIRSMLQNRRFDVFELTRVKWILRPQGGSIRFHLCDSKGRLDLSGYSKDDRLQIIRAVHDLVPTPLQEGWPLFCYKVALPLRGNESVILAREPSPESCTITRRRYDRMLVFCLPFSVALAVSLGVWLKLWQFTALPVLVIAAWLLLRFHVPVKGRVEARLTAAPHGRTRLFACTALVSSQLLMVGLALVGVGRPVALCTVCIVLLMALLPMLHLALTTEKQRRVADAQAAELASAKWEQGFAAAERTS